MIEIRETSYGVLLTGPRELLLLEISQHPEWQWSMSENGDCIMVWRSK